MFPVTFVVPMSLFIYIKQYGKADFDLPPNNFLTIWLRLSDTVQKCEMRNVRGTSQQ